MFSMAETSLERRVADLTYESSHFSRMSICSLKWVIVARKVGLSSAASLRPTGLCGAC